MRPAAPIAAVLALSLSLPALAADTFTARCTAITDGDTIKVLHEGAEIGVRLEGIDCPERKQPFGTKAKQATSDLVFGKDVRVVSISKDRYGRILGRVFVGEVDVNLELVRAGLAWHHVKYSDEEALAAAEGDARAARRGLWSRADAVPPWEWRRR